MVCSYCKSENLYIKETEGKASLYCKNCGRWVCYVNESEKQQIAKNIERQNRAIKVDSADVERVKEILKKHRDKLESLNSEFIAYKSKIDKKGIASRIAKSNLQEILLKTKEQIAKIKAYEEVLSCLRL